MRRLTSINQRFPSKNLNRPIVEKMFLEKEEFEKMMKDKNVVWKADKDYTVGLYNNTMMIREVDENKQQEI